MTIFSPSYGTWTDFTITLGGLASSSTLLAGREGTVVDNTSTLAEDYNIGGKITVGTTPTIDTRIEGWIYTNLTGLTTYPDVMDGTDSDETVTSAAIKRAAMTLAFVLDIDSTTSNRTYWIKEFSLVQRLGGVIPQKFGLFVTHNTGATLNATAANHQLSYLAVNGSSV
jgi:hypothetical protein